MDERTPEKTPANKLPSWLVASLAVMLIASMALFATLNLMQAYLTTKANERQAAYEAVLSNYHVVENAAGGRSITWQSVIERYASEYNLQPAFVAAIIRNESSFRTNAESNVGARGLMQLMPDTAEWIAGKLDDSSYSFDRMYDAETNIRYGCWYLGYLSELFRGDPILVSAAYHAGQGDVRGWLGDRSISADGLTVPLDKVPIAETRQYAGRVTQAYGIYQTLLYPENAFSAPSAALPADGADHRIAAAVR
ncbi:MAG: lytic transglycosylase domain-containing protein [Clostridia bacterium]|nr:lytic transglycosylase domain-containing protein [Clostridia bacterium]